MKSIILNQRRERDELLSRSYLNRHTSVDPGQLLSSPFIKLITGPRRAGKSTQALLMLRGKSFAYLNFDSQMLLDAWNADLVMRLLDDVYPGMETVDELEKVLKLVNNYNGENTTASDVDVKVLASLQKLTNRWVEVQQTKAKIVSAIYNLSFHDEQGVKHGLELSGNKLVSVDKKREAFEKITGKGEDYNESKED